MDTNKLIMNMLHKVTDRLPTSQDDFVNVSDTERWLSAAGGAAMTYYGLKNITSLTGITLALTGVPMLFRALSGFCPVNLAVGRDSAHPELSGSGDLRHTAASKE